MKKTIILISLTIFVGVLFADWNEGDDYKMHYPQLPDPYGWDVNCTWPEIIADDWQCTESGEVTDVHIWVSWKGDLDSDIIRVHLSIHDNVPVGQQGWSEPGALLWEQDFLQVQFSYIWYGEGNQGWFDPPSDYIEGDHINYYQINIVDISNPFYQEEGTIYWLDVSIEIDQPTQEEYIGWKTTQDHWNDDSVYWDDIIMRWMELRDPVNSESLDQAFVITSDAPPTPVELSSFTAFYHDGTPTLNWTTQTESNNIGWNVYRSETENQNDSFQANSILIPGAGTTFEPTEYTFIDENDVTVNNTYWYWIENRDESGATNTYGPISLMIPDNNGDNPDAPVIEGSIRNYPNPFYTSTEISFDLPEPANVKVTIYNTKGQKVQTIFNGYCNDDIFSKTWNAENMTSGIYMYVIEVGDETFSGKMILTR